VRRSEEDVRLALAAALWSLAACSGNDCKPGCASGSTAAVCSGTGAKTISCKGPNGCSAGVCDTSTHTLGDDCEKNGALRCDPMTATQVLLCEGFKLGKYRTCSGPRTCYTDATIDAGSVGCDFTAGDSCPPSYEGRYACDSVDPTGVLTCDAGTAVVYEHCMTGSCAQDGGMLVCQ
jgi:hypothetical protein